MLAIDGGDFERAKEPTGNLHRPAIARHGNHGSCLRMCDPWKIQFLRSMDVSQTDSLIDLMKKTRDSLKKADAKFLILSCFFLLTLFVTYSNHFNNDFVFDDLHTIVNNEYIRDISNIPKFFTDTSTMSTNPGNRAYRPVVITLNSIDYHIAGELDPFWFHVSIFTSYLVLLVFLFLFIKALFDLSKPQYSNRFFALFGTAFFALHAANAETINYIIARSDSFSTMCIVITMYMYFNQWTNVRRLYFIPMILGIYTKQVGVVVMPIIFIFILYFEEDLSLRDLFSFQRKNQLANAIRRILPIALISVGLSIFNQFVMTTGSSTNLFQSSLVSRFDYFTTQWFVIAHYLGNFILPINLSADPDIKIIEAFFDVRKMLGLVLILWLLYVAFKTSIEEEKRPISFGILWFFISLAPTSTFHPLGQISNDHRVFLPYIGLVISVTWYVALSLDQLIERFSRKKMMTNIALAISLIILLSHAYGANQRNIVWNSSESLWHDVTIKSPTNARGLMNYGLHLMERGEYEETLEYFEKALEYLPYFSHLHINMGILKNAMGSPREAENHFYNAIRYDGANPDAYQQFAEFLVRWNRDLEAMQSIKKGLEISPGHLALQRMLRESQVGVLTEEEKLALLIDLVKTDPSVNNLINLSLQYYNMRQYEDCIAACSNALILDPGNATAYSNICIAYVQLGEREKAIAACEKALAIEPNFQLAMNNLDLARSMK